MVVIMTTRRDQAACGEVREGVGFSWEVVLCAQLSCDGALTQRPA